MPPLSGDHPTISWDDLDWAQISSGAAVLVDVREPGELAARCAFRAGSCSTWGCIAVCMMSQRCITTMALLHEHVLVLCRGVQTLWHDVSGRYQNVSCQ